MRKAGLILGVLLATAATALPSRAATNNPTDVFDRTVPLAAGGRFTLDNVNGPVTITGWDREVVEIHAVKTAPEADSNLSDVRVDVSATPGQVTVTTTYPHGEDGGVSVAYSVRVPRRVMLQHVATVNGSIGVSGVETLGELHGVNGNIEVSDSAGAISARITNGDVRVELGRLAPVATMTIETVNGSITLALPENASATLDARSLNGDFRSALPLTVQGAYTPREFHGRLGDGKTALHLRTVNGAIRILAPPNGI